MAQHPGGGECTGRAPGPPLCDHPARSSLSASPPPVKAFVGITDSDWFSFLSARPNLDEVNFWQPSGATQFRALAPGELFLFKLHAPRQFIVGGAVFAYSTILPLSLAWD